MQKDDSERIIGLQVLYFKMADIGCRYAVREVILETVRT